MNRKGMLIVAAALLIWGGQGIIPNYGFAQTGVPVPEMVNVDKVFSNFMNEWNIPGGSIAIVKDGRLVYARGFGYADKESNELVQPYHLFRIASLSKPITSIAIMKLMEDGLIDVDAKVFGTNGILNGSEYSTILDPRVENITVRHLLHHTSGWGFINGDLDPMNSTIHIAREMGEDLPVGPVSIIKFMLTTQTLDNEPGTNYFYSNFGFCILGRVIEQVSGKSYENYVKTELLNPLGISEMQLGRNLYENKAPNEVKYYDFPGASLGKSVYGTGERVPRPYAGFNIETKDSGGGWIASAIDLVRLLVAVDGFDTKPDILSQPTIQLMTTPSSEKSKYGMGWLVNQSGNWWHTGGFSGTSSIFVRTSSGLGWAVLFNTRPSNRQGFTRSMDNMVWEAIRGINSWPTHDLFQHPFSDHQGGSIQLNGVTLKQLEPGVLNPIIFEGTQQKFQVEVEADEGEELESIRIYPSWVWEGDVLKDYPTKICRAFLGNDKTCKHSVTAEIEPHFWQRRVGEKHFHGISTWYAEITTESGKKSKITWRIKIAEDERVLGNGSFDLTPSNEREISVKVGDEQTFTAHWTNSQVYIILFTAEGAVPDDGSAEYAPTPGFAISEMEHSFTCKWDKPGKYTVKVYAILSHIGSLNNLSITDRTAENPEKWIVNVESNASDLVIESVQAEPPTVAPGGEFKLWATLKNKGPGVSSATTVRYYHRSRVLGFTRDVEIGKGRRDSLSVNETVRKNYVVTAPTELGTYEYRVCVDSVPKETDTRNNCSEIVTVTVGSEIVPELTSLADIALIIDSSGSMSGSDPGNLRKSGAQLFITSADPKVQIAIVDFDGSAQTFASLTFADATGKQKLASAVERVDAGGGTNIDAGLQQGFQELNASTSAAKKAAVLLTDGQDSVEQHVIQSYATKGWPIYTIGLGRSVERAELERIAHATGGEYFEASKANLQTVYNKILAKTTHKSVIASLAGYINKGQQIVKKVLLDDTLKRVDFFSDWQGSTIELVLIDPDGTQITPQDAAANSHITYQAAPTYAIYTLENPKPGNWQMQATGTDIPAGGESFNLTVNGTSDFLTNFLAFNSSYAVGDTIRIGIDIDERTDDTFAPVLGATTAAKIVRPDGKIDTLTLFDDGSHNDVTANDGVYANNYRSVDKQGTYLIQVSVENGFSREIQEQVVVGSIDNVFIDGSTLIPAAGATLKQTPDVISAVISGPAGRINANSIVLKVDGGTVTHTYNQVNQLVSYQPGGLSGGSHDVQLSLRDVSGSKIETTWSFSTQAIGAVTARTILTGHTGGVTSVAFSPNGQTIASGSDDNTVRLWDAATDTFNLKLTGHTGGVTSVAFSPSGQTIASGSEDKTIRLWDVSTGTEVKKLTGHTGGVTSVAFSPNGQTIASTSANRTVRLWDINTGTELKKIIGHTGAVFSVAFSPDGQRLASGGADNTVRLWDVNTGTQLGRLTGHTGAVFSVAFSPDGQTIASGGADGTLHLWDVNTGTQRQIFTGHIGPVYSVVFSPDGQKLVSGSSDKTALLWDVNPGTQPQILTGHTDAVLSVAFSPDGQKLASGSRDNTVRLWGSAPDVQPPELTADVNGDGVVDVQDLTLVYANLGKYGQNDADVNGDGIVNAEDIILVTAAIEAAGGAPALHTQVPHLFTREEVQQWLTEASRLADKSPAHRRGIAVLEQLLALLTPKETALLPNYPNPFNPETWIPYQLAKPADVTLTIYDINGRVVRALDLGHQRAGMYHSRTRAAYWDGKNKVGEPVASGVYFYTLKAGDFSATRKMLIRK